MKIFLFIMVLFLAGCAPDEKGPISTGGFASSERFAPGMVSEGEVELVYISPPSTKYYRTTTVLISNSKTGRLQTLVFNGVQTDIPKGKKVRIAYSLLLDSHGNTVILEDKTILRLLSVGLLN